jgi:type II secretory pathway pseudopilin PulG
MSLAKRNSLFWLAIAGLLILILAMSLPGLELSPGQSFSLGPTQPDAPGSGEGLGGGEVLLRMFQGVIGLALILLPVYLLYSLLTREGRNRLVADVVALGLIILFGEFLRHLPREAAATRSAADNPQSMIQLPGSEATVAFSAAPPPGLTLAVLLIISVLLVAAAGGLIWFFRRRRTSRQSAWKELAQEAQAALDTLQQGGDFKLTIMRCYQEMSRVVREERGLARETAMTPREFEDYLAGQGLARTPINTLTRLFEQVRYGGLPAESDDEAVALSCLTEIAEGCRSLGGRRER